MEMFEAQFYLKNIQHHQWLTIAWQYSLYVLLKGRMMKIKQMKNGERGKGKG
jgi:hypothetical protein